MLIEGTGERRREGSSLSSRAPGGGPDAGAVPEDKNHLEEWKAARDTLKAFDDRIHDLRKYGFTFITALLAAQSLLIPSLVPGVSSSSAVHEDVKLGVLLVTFLLLITLRFFERTDELFIDAAAIRASILEINLDLELTDTIDSRYKSAHIKRLVFAMYCLFAGATLLLGLFIVPDYSIELLAGFLLTLLSFAYVWSLDLQFAHGYEDWTTDRQSCLKGDPVRVTVMNLDSERDLDLLPDIVPKTDPRNPNEKGHGKGAVWLAQSTKMKDDGEPYEHVERVESKVTISHGGTYTWIWYTTDVEPGMYNIFPTFSGEKPPSWWRSARRKSSEPRNISIAGNELLWESPLPRQLTVWPGNSEDRGATQNEATSRRTKPS